MHLYGFPILFALFVWWFSTGAIVFLDGLPPRTFPSFWAAAREAGISRLYGGIHFHAAVELGLDQGRCIGGYVNALKTKN